MVKAEREGGGAATGGAAEVFATGITAGGCIEAFAAGITAGGCIEVFATGIAAGGCIEVFATGITAGGAWVSLLRAALVSQEGLRLLQPVSLRAAVLAAG